MTVSRAWWRCFLLFSACLSGTASNVSLADKSVDAVVRQQQLEILEQQDILQRERKAREIENDLQLLGPAFETPAPSADEGTCFTISTLDIQGVDDLPEAILAEVLDATTSYVDRCLYLAQLSDIVQRLNGIFLDAGLVTTRAFLPEQKLADGKLIVRIIVGRISGLQSETLTPRQLDWAVPARPGELLNLRDIEQGLDQLNRLQSNQATIQMLPGALPGESVVRIESVRSSSYGARFTLTGNDIADGDDYRGRVDLRADDLAGINDSLSLNFNQALAERASAASYGYGFDYALPYGYSTFSLSGSRFEYDNTASGAVRTFEVSGDSTTLSTNANHTLFRNRIQDRRKLFAQQQGK